MDRPVHSFTRPARLRSAPGAPTFGAAFIGRQPILDRSMDTYGYELLYRRAGQVTATFTDLDAASAEVALDAFLEFGLPALVRSKKAFINITHDVLLSGFCRELPRDGVVLELLEGLPCDVPVLRAVADLADAGYEIALDDYTDGDPREALLPWTSIVKIDVEGQEAATLAKRIEPLKALGIRLVAERIETPEGRDLCAGLGFTYFQGFFFARPQTVKGRRIPVERITALQVLAQLSDPNSTLDAVADAVARSEAVLPTVARPQLRGDRAMSVLLFPTDRQLWVPHSRRIRLAQPNPHPVNTASSPSHPWRADSSSMSSFLPGRPLVPGPFL